jgi:MFS family permease
MSEMKQVTRYGIVVAIMFMNFFIPTHGIVSSTFGAMAESYPNVSASALTYVTAVVNVTQVIASIGAGVLLGRKLKYRTAGIFSLFLFTLAGGLPFLLGSNLSFGILLASRCLFGLGLGAFAPIVNSSITYLFDKENTRASMMGLKDVFFSLGATFGNIIAGILCLISWQTTYVFYLFGIIPLIFFVIFYKEPAVVQESKTEKIKLPKTAFYYLFLLLIVMLLSQFNWNYIAFILTDMGYTSAVIGTIVTCFTVGAILGGLAYGIFYRFFKHFILFAAMVLISLSFVILYTASNSASTTVLFFFGLAFFLYGFASTQFTAGIPMSLSLTVPASGIAAAMGLFFACQNFGSFLASPVGQLFFSIVGEDAPINTIFILGLVVALILTVVALITSMRDSKLAKMNNQTENHSAISS